MSSSTPSINPSLAHSYPSSLTAEDFLSGRTPTLTGNLPPLPNSGSQRNPSRDQPPGPVQSSSHPQGTPPPLPEMYQIIADPSNPVLQVWQNQSFQRSYTVRRQGNRLYFIQENGIPALIGPLVPAFQPNGTQIHHDNVWAAPFY
jgi:hypothetical protein